jgi:hypothetical protein
MERAQTPYQTRRAVRAKGIQIAQTLSSLPHLSALASQALQIFLIVDMAGAARFVVPIRQALSSQRAPMTRQYMQRPHVCKWRGEARRTFSAKAARRYFSTFYTAIAGY